MEYNFNTPEFWFELAAKFRRPETFGTGLGICHAMGNSISPDVTFIENYVMGKKLIYLFRPEGTENQPYFFPLPHSEYRTQRADLCERIGTAIQKNLIEFDFDNRIVKFK